MKGLAAGIVALMSFLPPHCAAQRAGFHGGGNSAPRASFNFGLPPVGPIPPLGPIRVFDGFGPRFGANGRGMNRGGGWGFPGVYGFGAFPDYYNDYYSGEEYQTPNVVMPSAQICPAVIPEPPPQPARPELHEYKWPNTGNEQPAVFTIVMQRGPARTAVAVWLQGNFVHYVAPDGTAARLPLGSIDREATRRANAEKHLTLQLPARNNVNVVR